MLWGTVKSAYCAPSPDHGRVHFGGLSSSHAAAARTARIKGRRYMPTWFLLTVVTSRCR